MRGTYLMNLSTIIEKTRKALRREQTTIYQKELSTTTAKTGRAVRRFREKNRWFYQPTDSTSSLSSYHPSTPCRKDFFPLPGPPLHPPPPEALKLILPYPKGYPTSPARLSLTVYSQSATFPSPDDVKIHLSITNETDHPVTFNTENTLLIPFDAFTCRHFTVADTATGEVSVYDYNVMVQRGGPPCRTWDEEDEATFLTIPSKSSHVWTISNHLNMWHLQPRHEYEFKIVKAGVRWWAYGTKRQLLAPKPWSCRKQRWMWRLLGRTHLIFRYNTCVFRYGGERKWESADVDMREMVVRGVGEGVVFAIETNSGESISRASSDSSGGGR
jgi:hypothetical protein